MVTPSPAAKVPVVGSGGKLPAPTSCRRRLKSYSGPGVPNDLLGGSYHVVSKRSPRGNLHVGRDVVPVQVHAGRRAVLSELALRTRDPGVWPDTRLCSMSLFVPSSRERRSIWLSSARRPACT